jgi:hypothetical protein
MLVSVIVTSRPANINNLASVTAIGDGVAASHVQIFGH